VNLIGYLIRYTASNMTWTEWLIHRTFLAPSWLHVWHTNKVMQATEPKVCKFTYHLYHMLHGDILHRNVMPYISTCQICYSIVPGLPDLVLHDKNKNISKSQCSRPKEFTLQVFIYDLNHEPQRYKKKAMNNMTLYL